ncbi:MAG: protease family protein [Thermoplasmata archaeon]|jgi:membrane protease YdiL (CAAX protease family)|nr:protease family protein [Thermoplasmata archaeon]
MRDLPFDPATGAWRAATPRPPPATPALPPEARKPAPGGRGWDVVLGVDVGLLALLGVLVILSGLAGPAPEGDLDAGAFRQALYVQSGAQLLLMAAIPLAWGLGTRLVPVAGTLRYFRLTDPGKGILKGLAWGAAILGAFIAIGLLLEKSGVSQDNPVKDQLVEAMTWPLVVAVATAAAVGEEVFFRGWMIRRLEEAGARRGLSLRGAQVLAVGVSSLLFGLAHFGYGTPLQVILPGALGVLFGAIVVRGGSLWTVIVAHFVYDFVALSVVLIDPGAAP